MLGDGPLTADVAITNAHGNVGSGSRDFTLDTGVPGIRIDALTGDNVLNIAELALDVWVTGMTYGVEPGATVTVTIGSDIRQTTVNPDGSWAFSVPQSVAGGWTGKLPLRRPLRTAQVMSLSSARMCRLTTHRYRWRWM
ncbi:hypothetical protein ACFSKS_15580 [Pseudocitrobacter faecalis]